MYNPPRPCSVPLVPATVLNTSDVALARQKQLRGFRPGEPFGEPKSLKDAAALLLVHAEKEDRF
eukprot:393690-Alexandrium_andersonii.AAC.1